MNTRSLFLTWLAGIILCLTAGCGRSHDSNSSENTFSRPGTLADLPILTGEDSRAITAENPTGAKGAGGKFVPDTNEINPPVSARAADALGRGWKVRPFMRIKAGQTATLMDVDGPGVIRHIFMSEGLSRNHVLRFYWDGEPTPSIEVPAPDFFAVGHERFAPVNSQAVIVNPANALNCYWPMPFRKHAWITFANEGKTDLELLAFQIDYALTKVPEDAAYFHAQWRRADTSRQNPYVILDGVSGDGKYAGTFLAWTQHRRGWFGEGEVKFYIDGDDKFPTICGTGTEDYFGCSYGFPSPVSTVYNGSTLPSQDSNTPPNFWSLYRWHIPDPISFHHDLKVTIQALGWGDDGNYLQLSDNIASVAYWYQTEPHAPFSPLPSAEQRAPESGPIATEAKIKGFILDLKGAKVSDSRGSLFAWTLQCEGTGDGDHYLSEGWQAVGQYQNYIASGQARIDKNFTDGVIVHPSPGTNRIEATWPIKVSSGQRVHFRCCLTDQSITQSVNGAAVDIDLVSEGKRSRILSEKLKPREKKWIDFIKPLAGTEDHVTVAVDNLGSQDYTVVFLSATLEE